MLRRVGVAGRSRRFSGVIEWTPKVLGATALFDARQGVTVGTGLAAWANQGIAGSSLDLLCAVATSQATIDTGIGGVSCPRFISGTSLNDYAAAAAEVAASRCMHDGTGCTWWFAGSLTATPAAATRVLFCTGGVPTTGAVVYCPTSGSRSISFRVHNGGTQVINLTVGTPAESTPFYAVGSYSTADGGRVYFNGSAGATSAELSAPSAGASTIPLTIGYSASVRSADQAVRSLGIVPRVLTERELALLHSYLTGLIS